MSRTFLLQDWTTVRSSLSSTFVQDPDCWLDLDGFSDVTCWVDVAEVTPPGGSSRNSLNLQVQTAPSADDAYFVPIAAPLAVGVQAPFVQPALAPNVVRSAKTSVSNNLMRHLRWGIVPIGSGAWDLTFRIHAIAARSPTFVPPLVPGCVAWYRADLGVTCSVGSSSVTAWNDQSGTGDANKNLSATGTPTLNASDGSYFGAPTISFSGSSQYMTSGPWASALLQPNTWIVVGHRANTASQMDAMDGATSGFGQLIAGAAGNASLVYANSNLSTPTNSAYAWTSPSVLLAEFNGTTSSIYMNDFTSAAVTGPAGAANFDALCVASHNPAFTPGNYWNGTIAEIIAYAGPLLSPGFKAQLRTYFMGRYGISIG